VDESQADNPDVFAAAANRSLESSLSIELCLEGSQVYSFFGLLIKERFHTGIICVSSVDGFGKQLASGTSL